MLASAGISLKRGSSRSLISMLILRRRRRRLGWYDALPSGWFAAWLGMLLGFCHLMFPVPPDESPAGIHWPTRFGGSCNGGMLPLSLPPLRPSSVGRASSAWPYKTTAALDTLRQWQDIMFTGEPLNDFMAFASATNAVKASPCCGHVSQIRSMEASAHAKRGHHGPLN